MSRMISAYENRSLAYPLTKVFLTQFGTVSGSTYRQAVYPPFMVELFVLEGFAFDARTLSSIRFHASPHENSPRRPTLNEAFENCTRFAFSSFAPNPVEGFGHAWPHPFQLLRPLAFRRRVCPGRPASRAGRSESWDRTMGLLRTIGITPQSLPRTGQATLVASGSTGLFRCG